MITEGEKIFNFEIKVKLKEGILDPQGNATLKVLKRLNFSVEEVRFGKSVNLKIKEENFEKAKQKAEQIAYEVLSNPVLEDYEIMELDEE
ncbi:phosphoribosylformylglycinamidine synthase [Petrotoga sp. 9PW.55.5.1]|uniref:phosphoribosylformylglycinamidine synthase subunit PurS n=1 Tax=Petrotoga sp. 9PW.55.5.1 TaxID=1308979 RepID=UPI000DC51A81|nr:phosphoribosylformylglycinamidine synthase subunit PurS [Petrotoga sp. 9PW.55.5.1]RAO98412.1 phosphoribosylformylglycinamidine synthase [Petrotoga sp. 9PW.55.5.1]